MRIIWFKRPNALDWLKAPVKHRHEISALSWQPEQYKKREHPGGGNSIAVMPASIATPRRTNSRARARRSTPGPIALPLLFQTSGGLKAKSWTKTDILT